MTRSTPAATLVQVGGRVGRLLWTVQMRLAVLLAIGLPLLGFVVTVLTRDVGPVFLLMVLGWWVAWSGTPAGQRPSGEAVDRSSDTKEPPPPGP